MTGRERILKALQCKEVDRIPWLPFVGVHGAHLLGITATEYLQSGEKIVAGINAAVARYLPDGIPVAFDLQIEAETLGCKLVWSDENPPAVVSHPLAEGVPLEQLQVPGPEVGRVGLVLKAARVLRQAHPDIALYGLITGPFTLALHLMGTDIFMRMFDEPEQVHQTLAFCSQVAQAMAKYYLEAGCDAVAVVDPMTSQIGPDQFREFVTPRISPVFAAIRKQGGLSSFFVCGHAQQNIEAMCQCRPDNVSVDENIPLEYVRDICLRQGISFGGNLQLTTVLLLGTPADAQRNALACLDVGGKRGYILAPGCDLPFATPPANLEAISKLVLDPYQQAVISSLTADKPAQDLLDMADYGQMDRVIVDIVTLDSEACAPCQYMVEAVRSVAPEFEGIVEWREHKIKYRESLVFMTSLMIKNIPTICIDGKITFVSRIPARDELIAAIQKRIYEKLRLQIQRRRASVFVLGDGGKPCRELLERAERAVEELGAQVEVRLITDEKEMHALGVAPVQTPAVILARYQLKSARNLPEVAIIKEWLKDVH